jgi:O-antigen/teichoic acid export membrane protein
MLERLRAWRQDRLLGGILKSSSYLFSSNAILAVFSFVQGVLATRLLGIEGYGLVSGTVIVFASNIHRLLSFRMSEMVVKYLGGALADGQRERGAAAVKAAALAEALTSLIAYGVLLLLAPWAARALGKNLATAPLFTFYGLVLLANLVFETATGVLQATRRFDRIAAINVIQAAITFTLIVAAFIFRGGVWHVLAAYLLGKTFTGLAVAASAFGELNRALGRGWPRVSLRALPDWRAATRFVISTNLNGTVNLFVRDSETLLIGFFRSQTEVGYYRLALGIINLVMLPIEPFIWPTYAEITRVIAQRQWAATRRLLKRVSAIAGAWTLAAGGGLALLGWWVIPMLYGPDTGPAYPAVLILLIGYGIASIVQWNRPLLLALGQPGYPLKVSVVVGIVKTALTVGLAPAWGYLGEAAILSGYFVVSIGLTARRGLQEIGRQLAVTNSQ